MAETKKARVTWKGSDLDFHSVLGSGYEIDMSSQASPERGGSPMEMLLAGIAGCTAVDIVHILRKQRQPVEGVEVEIVGTRAETDPKYYTELDLMYVIRGAVEATAVERAIELSETKYCSASFTFRQAGAVIRSNYRIEAPQPQTL